MGWSVFFPVFFFFQKCFQNVFKAFQSVFQLFQVFRCFIKVL